MRRQGEKAKESRGGSLKWILGIVVLALVCWFVFILNFISAGTSPAEVAFAAAESGKGKAQGEFSILHQSSNSKVEESTRNEAASSKKDISISMSMSSAASSVGSVGSEEDVHVVFSTDCSEYQDWQSITLFYSAMLAGQTGMWMVDL